jgi:hypothetical protein
VRQNDEAVVIGARSGGFGAVAAAKLSRSTMESPDPSFASMTASVSVIVEPGVTGAVVVSQPVAAWFSYPVPTNTAVPFTHPAHCVKNAALPDTPCPSESNAMLPAVVGVSSHATNRSLYQNPDRSCPERDPLTTRPETAPLLAVCRRRNPVSPPPSTPALPRKAARRSRRQRCRRSELPGPRQAPARLVAGLQPGLENTARGSPSAHTVESSVLLVETSEGGSGKAGES